MDDVVDSIYIIAVSPTKEDEKYLTSIGFKSMTYDYVMGILNEGMNLDFTNVTCDVLVGGYPVVLKRKKVKKSINVKGKKVIIKNIDRLNNKMSIDVI